MNPNEEPIKQRNEIYCLDCDKSENAVKTLSQGVSYIRSDGMEFSLKDHFNGDIADDENADYSKIHQTTNWGTFTLTDKNGKSREFQYHINNLYGKDILDSRRVTQKIGEYIAELPEEVINRLIESNVKEISFEDTYEEYREE